MAQTRRRHSRPWVVTLAAILVGLSGLYSALIGLFVLLARYQVEQDLVLTVSLVGAGIILFGLLMLTIAGGIARGSRVSRILVTAYVVLLLALMLTTIIATDPWDVFSIVSIVLCLFVLVVLWVPPGSRHFTSREPARDPLAP